LTNYKSLSVGIDRQMEAPGISVIFKMFIKWKLNSCSVTLSHNTVRPKSTFAAKIDFNSKNWIFFFFLSFLMKLCFLNPNLVSNCGKAYANPPNLVCSLQLIKPLISHWNLRNFELNFWLDGHISMANKKQ
jgi:hypothetical protein